jgi:selenide,water dikinase
MIRNANVVVNSNTFDDAGIYRLDDRRALVQTVDFFTPIVDDPFAYGQIAAANALSDVFAMGGRPLTALNIMGFPINLVSSKTIAEILRGGATKAAEVNCAIVGGHSIRNPEPIYGLAVTGIVDLRRILTNAKARAGDLLVLTKPLGTGIATTAIKRGLASSALQKKVISLMSRINLVGAELAEKRLAHAATDVTGFGLIGHLANMCRASGVSAEIDPARVPILDPTLLDLIKRGCIPGGTRDNLAAANSIADWCGLGKEQRTLLTDAQTSGGLLLSVPERSLDKVLRLLKRRKTAAAAVIGKLVRRRRGRMICMTK